MTDSLHAKANAFLEQLNQIVLGKPHQVKLAAASIFAGGHILIEDLPGMGKTTLAQAISRLLGLRFQRVQFTADMLPSDLVGVSIFNPESRKFEFHRGPVFTEVLLADEVNRAMPKTQSALLEVMEEKQVSIEGQTYRIGDPFFVIATQNPYSQIGANPLPESQLDRFLMSISLGYPDQRAEMDILLGRDRRESIDQLVPVFDREQLLALQRAVAAVHASEGLVRYLLRLVRTTRESREFEHGLSPRAAKSLLQAARAWAYLGGREHVLPDDVQAVFEPVSVHRLYGSVQASQTALSGLVQSVKVVD